MSSTHECREQPLIPATQRFYKELASSSSSLLFHTEEADLSCCFYLGGKETIKQPVIEQ